MVIKMGFSSTKKSLSFKNFRHNVLFKLSPWLFDICCQRLYNISGLVFDRELISDTGYMRPGG